MANILRPSVSKVYHLISHRILVRNAENCETRILGIYNKLPKENPIGRRVARGSIGRDGGIDMFI